MEADIAVEGARHLLKAGAAIGVLICDGDTKTATAIRMQVPELKGHVVIWNDLNHMAINLGKSLREDTGLSAAEAALLQSSFARAVKQAREEEEERRKRGEKERSGSSPCGGASWRRSSTTLTCTRTAARLGAQSNRGGIRTTSQSMDS